MKKAIFIALAMTLLLTACGGSGASQFQGFRLTQAALGGSQGPTVELPTFTPSGPITTSTPVVPTDTPAPLPSATPTADLFPVVTFTQNANCRKGPSGSYYNVLSYLKGQTAKASGRSADGSWLWVQYPDGSDYCWVLTSNVEAPASVNDLRVITPQPLPDDPWGFAYTRVACGDFVFVRFSWNSVVGATEYRLYKNGALIVTLHPGETEWMDEPRNAKSFTYSMQVANDFGVSNRISLNVPGCP